MLFSCRKIIVAFILVKSMLELCKPLCKMISLALISVAQLIGHHLTKQKVAGSIPGQGTCLGCEFSPQSGCIQEATD